MQKNNTSSFNYRKIEGKDKLSMHSFGFAIDINPFQNPCIIDANICPKRSKYSKLEKGTILKDSDIVKFFNYFSSLFLFS